MTTTNCWEATTIGTHLTRSMTRRTKPIISPTLTNMTNLVSNAKNTDCRLVNLSFALRTTFRLIWLIFVEFWLDKMNMYQIQSGEKSLLTYLHNTLHNTRSTSIKASRSRRSCKHFRQKLFRLGNIPGEGDIQSNFWKSGELKIDQDVYF